MTVLKLTNVVKQYSVREGFRHRTVEAVKGVSFALESGRTTALVGESGSGKSTIARMLTGLERPTSGEITVDDVPLGRTGKAVRNHQASVSMVFQDPFASLNPYHSIEHHLARPLRNKYPKISRRDLDSKVDRLLERVNLTPASQFKYRRPHELSGGQRQRVAIARALAPEPRVLLADEPVSMLHVSIRLGVLNLLAQLQREENLAVLYITHDLATARHFSDDILVMFRGDIVEQGPAEDVILRPTHEYTRKLLSAAPDPSTHPRFVQS